MLNLRDPQRQVVSARDWTKLELAFADRLQPFSREDTRGGTGAGCKRLGIVQNKFWD
jgi:hypothetical protein